MLLQLDFLLSSLCALVRQAEAWQVLQAERSLPCKLPVRRVAERACVGVIQGAEPREAKVRAVTQVNPIRPRYTNESGQPAGKW